MDKDESSSFLLRESDDGYPETCQRCLSRDPRTRKHHIVRFCLQVVFLVLAVGTGVLIDRAWRFEPEDNNAALARYDTYRDSFGPINAADNTSAAEEFWTSMRHHHGFVSLPPSSEQPFSVADPKNKENRLYQIRGFHSFHCLWRIRNRIISDVPLDEWPRADPHTLHCIDHIRRDLMCNPSVALLGSNDFQHFHNMPLNGLQCRNLDALIDYAAQHRWNPRDTPKGLRMLDPLAEEKSVWRQKLQLDAETGRRIPYDELEFAWDEEMHIRLKLLDGEVDGDGRSLCFGKCTTAAPVHRNSD